MFLKFVLLLGIIGQFAEADDGAFKAFMGDGGGKDMVSEYSPYDFKHVAMEKKVHVIDSDLLAMKERGLVVENPEFLAKLLKMVMSDEFKKEEYSEEDLKAALAFIIKLIESTVGDVFLKAEEFSKVLKDPHGVADVSKMIKYKPEVSYASGEHFGGKKADKSVNPHIKDEETRLFEAITELKASQSMVPPFGKPISEDILKTALYGEKALAEGKHLNILKTLEGLKVESMLHEEKLLPAKSLEAKIPHPIVRGKEHKDAKAHHLEEGFKNHKAIHEEVVDHHKDAVFDEILKQEEAHAYGEDLGIKESSEFDEELFPHSVIHKLHKELDKAGLDAKKDLSSEEILKEKDLRIDETKNIGIKADKDSMHKSEAKDTSIKQDGTHAYEKAKDQAKKDASIPFSEEGMDDLLFDEALKKFLSGTKVEPGKMVPETIKKDKASVDDKEITRKIFEEHDITGRINHGIKVDEGISKGIHHGIKVDEGISKGIHHGIKVDEGILKGMHGIKLDEEIAKGIHGSKIDEGILKGMHGIKVDEGISKGMHGIKIDEDISKGMHGIKLDEEIAKGVKVVNEHFPYGIDKHIYLSEEADKTVPVELTHRFSFIKKKAKEILSHILQMKKCHLVSMRPGELLSIVDCVSKSK